MAIWYMRLKIKGELKSSKQAALRHGSASNSKRIHLTRGNNPTSLSLCHNSPDSFVHRFFFSSILKHSFRYRWKMWCALQKWHTIVSFLIRKWNTKTKCFSLSRWIDCIEFVSYARIIEIFGAESKRINIQRSTSSFCIYKLNRDPNEQFLNSWLDSTWRWVMSFIVWIFTNYANIEALSLDVCVGNIYYSIRQNSDSAHV